MHQNFETGSHLCRIFRDLEGLQSLDQAGKVPMIPMPVNSPGKCLKNSVESRLSTRVSVVKIAPEGTVERRTTICWSVFW